MTQTARHFILRSSNYVGGKPSGKPDGMMVRNDGYFTDAKVSAKVFDTEVEAEQFYNDVVKVWQLQMHPTTPLSMFVVPVVTKIVVKQVSSSSGKPIV